jgi:hypothetical protein
LRPLPVAPVVNTAAGPVEAVLGPPSRLLTGPRAQKVENLRVVAKTPLAHFVPAGPQRQQAQAHPPATPRLAPQPRTLAPAPTPAPAPVEASAVYFPVESAHCHGRGKKLVPGRNKPHCHGHGKKSALGRDNPHRHGKTLALGKDKSHVPPRGHSEAAAKGRAEGHERVKTNAKGASPGNPTKTRTAPPGKPETKTRTAPPGKPEAKPKKAPSEEPQATPAPVAEQDPGPARGREDDDHGGEGRGGGKK